MKKVSLSLLSVLLLVLTTACTQVPTVSNADTAQGTEVTKTLLWEITGNGLEQPSFIFGTIHIICEEDFLMTDVMKRSFDKTEQLVLEIDMDDQSAMAEVQQKMMDLKGIDYKGKMDGGVYKKLDSLLVANVGMGMQVGRMMKPIALMSVAYLSLLDCGEPTGYEEEFMKLSKEAEMEVLGLETGLSQLAIFDDIPLEEQIGWINELLAESGEAKQQFEEMTRVFLEQDVEALYDSYKDYPEYEKYEDALLTNRNNDWIPKIEAMAKEKPSFFAVGAMHLGGENGVLKLLRDKGYTVKGVIK